MISNLMFIWKIFFQDEILDEENDTVHVITKTEKVVGEFIIMYSCTCMGGIVRRKDDETLRNAH